MAYKTFKDMKRDIPEGATHYHNETDDYLFCWFKIVGNKWFVFCPDDVPRWEKCNLEHHRSGIVQFLQTETPPEREALDMIDTTSKQVESLANDSELPNGSEWDGEGLPPVGVECECLIDDSGFWRGCTVIFSSELSVVVVKLNSGSELAVNPFASSFRKPESPKQKAERERLESAYELFSLKHEVSYSNIDVMSISDFSSDSQLRDGYLAIVDKTGYRKESK